MNCEVVAVGTELLLGQIVDTNSSWIGEQLALAGIDSYVQTKVGDNWDRIATSLRTGLFLRSEVNATSMVTPAEGPSLGMAPAGTWMWISFFSKKSSSIPSSFALVRTYASAAWADSFITSPN